MLPPFPLEGSNGRTRFAVVQLTSRRPEGDVRYEDVQGQDPERSWASSSRFAATWIV